MNDRKEEFEQSLYTFKHALMILQKDSSGICDVFDNHNVAWELKDELNTGRYLLNVSHGYLKDEVEKLIREFISKVDMIQESVLHETKTRDENIIAMSHSCWIELRGYAKTILDELETNSKIDDP